MGYADGFYYGQGRIICDTSTFSVGDTIRVRSMTDSSKVWNQQVATVGTALVFTVPCYDYYKICTVQDIGGTPTEIGGVYKTVDYGQTLFINVLDKATLGGCKGILNSHQETNFLSIGDIVPITVNGNPWDMQISGINVYHAHDIMLTSRYVLSTSNAGTNYSSSSLRTAVQTFYNDIAENDRQYIEKVQRRFRGSSGTEVDYEDYCFVLGNKETVNVTGYGVVSSQVQMPLFVTQANRMKTYNGTALPYWTSDNYDGTSINTITTNGTIAYNSYTNVYGVVPSFMLVADS